MKKLTPIIGAFVVALTAMISGGSVLAAGGSAIFNSTISPLPGNLPSLGFQATQTSEFGDRITFAGTARNLSSATVTMSSWGCQNGAWYNATCVTTPGATFNIAITLNIYNAGSGGAAGALIVSKTQTFAIPYRPSTDNVNCSGGPWFDASSGSCFNGKATNITFDFDATTILPNTVVYGVSYNTTSYGPNPVGTSAACFSTLAGCPYDSLNVGLNDVAGPTVGTDVDPDAVFWNTSTAGNYTDGGTGGVGTFRQDTNWSGYVPAVKFAALAVAASADDCKKDGWQTLVRANGTTFKNQGDCVSYTKNGR